IGTAEALARVQVLNDAGEISQGSTDLVQLRLESQVVAVPGERFIIRSYSPQATIAGGEVIDNSPPRHRRKDLNAVRDQLSARLAANGDVGKLSELLVEAAGRSGVTLPELQAAAGVKQAVLRQ